MVCIIVYQGEFIDNSEFYIFSDNMLGILYLYTMKEIVITSLSLLFFLLEKVYEEYCITFLLYDDQILDTTLK